MNVYFKKFVKNNGFTVTELMIAVALTSIVGVGIFQVLTNSNKMSNVLNKRLDDRIESKLGDKIILRDLRNAGASFNNITATDDNNNDFFDFDADRSSAFYRKQQIKSRTLSLIKNRKTTFYVLSFDDLRGKSLFTDVVTFFDTSTPNNVDMPATLTYKGLNNNDYLIAKDKNNNFLNNPLLIEEFNLEKLIMVDSSAYMPVIPQRPAVFIGRVHKSGDLFDITQINHSEIPSDEKSKKKIFNYFITPVPNISLVPSSFENFLYNLPPVGANGASVRIKPVRLFKYELDCPQEKKSECILYRSDVLSGKNSHKMPVLRGYEVISFKRKDIASSVFSISTYKTVEEFNRLNRPR